MDMRKNFKGPYHIYDPKLDIAKLPRLWVGKIEWEGPLVEWPPKGRAGVFFDGEKRTDDAYVREIFARFLPRAYRGILHRMKWSGWLVGRCRRRRNETGFHLRSARRHQERALLAGLPLPRQ
jgi:hypothetical protein